MISLNDVLLAMSNIPVDDPIAEIWGRGLQGGYRIIEYTGSLPITISANGDALIDYRIYGDDGGVGEPTENLIDADKPGTQRVELEPNTDYCLCKYTGAGQGGMPSCYVYDENNNQLFGDYINAWVSYSFTNPSNGAYARILFSDAAEGKVSFTKGRADNNNSLYPANYIPYGYKLPMVTIKNLFNPNGTYEANKYKNNNGTIHSYNGAGYYTQYMPINSEDLISVKNARGDDNLTIRLYYYDSQKNWIGRSGGSGYVTDFTETPIAGAAFIQLQLGTPYAANADKIIISQGGTTTPVYIGEARLDEGEYVSYGEQKIYKRTENLFELLDDMKDAKNWNLKMAVFEAYFIYYHLSPEQLTYLKNVGTVYGKAFKKEGGQYINGTVLAITNKELSTGVDTSMRLILNNGAINNYIHDFTQDVDAYLCIGYGSGITEETKQFFVDAILNNFDIMLSSTAPTSYIPYVAPTDPPVPLPEIPTIDGTTIIDYDGDPKPSQMYVKYKGKSDGA